MMMYTSQKALASDITGLMTMLDKSVDMLSQLMSWPKEKILADLYTMSGCDNIHEAFKEVITEHGIDFDIPTPTETVFKIKLAEMENQSNM